MVNNLEEAKNRLKKNSAKNTVKNKRVPKIEIGQTLESNDLFLPHDKNRIPKSKPRPVITAYINKFGEMIIIPGSKQNTRNTKYYGKHGIEYYRKVIEVVDNEGKPIKVGDKFKLTKNCSKIPIDDIKIIRNNVINHGRFSSVNRQKYKEFDNRYKKRS